MKTKTISLIAKIAALFLLVYFLLMLVGCDTCQNCRQVCYECNFQGSLSQEVCSSPTNLPGQVTDGVNEMISLGFTCTQLETEVVTVCESGDEELILNMEKDGYLCYE